MLLTFRQSVLFLSAFIPAALLAPSFARAQDAEKLGTYGEWSAYSYTENGAKVCYMAASPKEGDAKGSYVRRGNIFAMVTHRPADDSTDVFSYLAGYSYAKGSKVSLKIDGQEFALFGTDETAWTPSDDADHKLVAALRKGSKLVVSGSSAKGTATVDTISLKGSGEAYAKISKECKISN